MKYIALLRGINVSGKNKIDMTELKQLFINNKYKNVKTYLNSGNVIFESNIQDKMLLKNNIESIIFNKFKFNIQVYVLDNKEFSDIIENIPSWFEMNNKKYNNVIFIINKIDINDFGELIKNETIFEYKDIIYWSFSLSNYSKSHWWKNVSINKNVTIRTFNTIKKLYEIINKG